MYKGPLRFAHRGLTQQAPENTLEAFEAAVSYGCEGIEIDVQLTKDHQAVIFHDYNLTRMTLGCAERSSNGRICEMTWEELSCVQIPFANHLLLQLFGLIPPYFSAVSLLLSGLIAVVSSLILAAGTWPLYAFGQITADVHAIRKEGVVSGKAEGAAVPVSDHSAEPANSDELPEL